jgi:hypothetical protein
MSIRSFIVRGLAAFKRPLVSIRGLIARVGGAIGRGLSSIRRLLLSVFSRRPVLIAAVALIVVALVGSGIAIVDLSASSATPTPEATAIAEATATPTAVPTPTLAPTPTPLPSLIATPTPQPMVAATTDGVWLPASQAALATRKPIAVMIDDHWDARPQSGLSMANIVYQGPAEGGIPRYMAIFQTQAPPAIGPIRSARLYFVAWAEEYGAGYVHMWGAPNAMNRLASDTGKYIFNIDGLRYGGMSGYMWRTSFRAAPHNLYTSYAKLEALTVKIGGTAPLTTSEFTFADPLPPSSRLVGGQIIVPYSQNTIVYNYDWATNSYPRTVSKEGAQYDAATGLRIAPSNVVLLTMNVGLLAGSPAALTKHRLDVQYVGHGSAMVFNNGLAIQAIWTKKNEHSATVLTYATGPNKGQPVPMVRGQIFVQVVPTYVAASWQTGYAPAPETAP